MTSYSGVASSVSYSCDGNTTTGDIYFGGTCSGQSM